MPCHSQPIKLLLRLLKGQCKLVRKIDLDDRLSSSFLGYVKIVGDSSVIENNVLDDVQEVIYKWELIILCCWVVNLLLLYFIFAGFHHR
jgi:hypothetical protein